MIKARNFEDISNYECESIALEDLRWSQFSASTPLLYFILIYLQNINPKLIQFDQLKWSQIETSPHTA